MRDFAQMMTTLGGDRLKGWLARVCLDSLPGLRSIANRIERDKAAVIAGLSLPSCGPLEGRGHHLKAAKRQMFNRAGFPLLRKRVLLTAA